MVDSGALDTESATPSRPAWQADRARGSGGIERHSVGTAYRGGLGRFTRTFPLRVDLFPRLQSLDAPRRAAGDPGGIGPGFGGSGQDRSLRMLYRRHLRGGEKGGFAVGKTKRGKGTKLMVIADASGLPLAVHATSASPHEVTLVEATLAQTLTLGRPQRLIGDRAYDSDPLDQRLAAQGIALIAPHRAKRSRPRTQDERVLRRYQRRWKIERLFAWLNKFKRVMTRWDRLIEHFLAFVHLACAMILMRRYL
jgi:transposase